MRGDTFWTLNQESVIININIVDVVVLIITIAEVFSDRSPDRVEYVDWHLFGRCISKHVYQGTQQLTAAAMTSAKAAITTTGMVRNCIHSYRRLQ